jgi:uncharacterized alpha-E superfamily protein
MLSRVAESVYWVSRYLERAENVARFVDVNYNLTLGDSAPLADQWSPLIYTTGDQNDFNERYDSTTRENALQFLLFDAENPNSILSCISNAREAARTVREVIPSSVWENLNRFKMLVENAAKSRDAFEQPHDFCDSVRTTSQLLAGIANSSMLRDEAWLFSQMGRNIERADKTSRIVDVQYFLLLPKARDVGTSIDVNRWSSLLKSADALDMYRRTHGRIVPNTVAKFLILEPLFPRSIRFCVEEAAKRLRDVKQQDEREVLPSSVLMKQLVARMGSITIEEIVEQGMHSFIDQLQGALNGLGNAIYEDFFNTSNQQKKFIAQSQSQVMGSMMQQQS